MTKSINNERLRAALTTRPAQVAMLVFAILPTGLVILIALQTLLSFDPLIAWEDTIWPIVILQALAIVAYCAHARSNRRLSPDEVSEWIVQFILYIPFGTLSYWNKHISGRTQL